MRLDWLKWHKASELVRECWYTHMTQYSLHLYPTSPDITWKCLQSSAMSAATYTHTSVCVIWWWRHTFSSNEVDHNIWRHLGTGFHTWSPSKMEKKACCHKQSGVKARAACWTLFSPPVLQWIAKFVLFYFDLLLVSYHSPLQYFCVFCMSL